ncbi:hypothetical protein [Arcticibacterium luteifluviistationis]|uniref:Uncharacterized protein n=1 Tax=Arcticibacterium luteifluviistationis TaxID=1784714 RepID=A0A2Z4GEJ1_9BACT|nr:hypothetical protein [Arcticibacterium luteifluviistationis]AWV99666.1 hypothetical protein DJ013_16400 [Arcticibacterium luteifluviistationis]
MKISFSKYLFSIWGIWALISAFPLNAYGQNPHLSFITKKANVGENIQVALVYKHNAESDVFFPNKTSYFSPFELKGFVFFPTHTKDSISVDSVIYTLRTFDVDKIQTFKLPVWVLEDGDSTTFWSNTDSLFLSELVPDSSLRNRAVVSSVDFIKKKDNTMLSIGLLVFFGVLLLLGLMALIFQNKIKKQVLLYRFQEKQKVYNKRFLILMKSELDPSTLEEFLGLWRNQMKWMEKKPFDSLSSVEIEKISGQKIGLAIREIETSLFGGQNSDRIPLALQILYSYSKERFRERRLAYKNQLKKIY